MTFSKVVFDDSVDTDIARVNRANGVLYLNPSIWKRLNDDEREFVLLHEKGHLELGTASEYQANKYAIGKYCPVANLTNAELGKRIQVITEITDPSRYISHLGADPVSTSMGIFQMATGWINTMLNTKNANANANLLAETTASEEELKKVQNTRLIIIGSICLVGLLFLVILVKY